MTFVIFVAGLILLIIGAEALVRGASRLAARLGLAPLVIGLTVVAFGTSSPELAVSLKAALADQAGIAMGNVVGSNIFNVLFILGLSAIIVPLAAAPRLVRLDIPLMILLSAGVWLLSLDGRIGRLDGLLLVAALTLYLITLFRQGTGNESAPSTAAPSAARSGWRDLGRIVVGLALLVLGARWLVESAVTLASRLGVSEQIIGLTLIAAGTSLPEVVTSIIAALRGERDIALGNVVGSNVFNILGVLGLTGLIAPSGIGVPEAMLSFDIPVMIAVALVCLPIAFTRGMISRGEGGLLLGYYLAYTLYLILAAGRHDALSGFSTVMLYFALPATALGLAMLAWQQLRRGPAP